MNTEEDNIPEIPVTPDDTAPENDVDMALAALSNLNELARDEPETREEMDETFADDRVSADESNPESWVASDFPQPPLSQLERGQAASVVPALILIGVGAFLTFLLTTNTTLPSDDFVLGLGLVGVGLSVMSYWLSSARWSRGSLMVGAILAVVGVVVVVL